MNRNIGVVQTVELIKELYDVKNNVSMFLNICNFFLSESALKCIREYKTKHFSLLLNIRLPSFTATWVCQPRPFSHATGVCHLDGDFLSLVSGSYPLNIVCRWSLMSYSGSDTRVNFPARHIYSV